MAAESVGAAVVQEAVKNLFELIQNHVSYIWKYKINIKSLKDDLSRIKDKLETVQRDVNDAKNNAEDIRQDVSGWLRTCEELKGEVDELLSRTRNDQLSCLCCKFPNLSLRYSLSRDATEKTNTITRYLGECTFVKVGRPKQPGLLPFLSPGEFYDFESRMSIVKEIMHALKDDSIFVIGICGMGGSGKTSLAKKIAEKVKSEKLFDDVAMAVVSQDPKVSQIQGDVASRLGLCAIESEINVNKRADLLYKRLMGDDEKKTSLIILDDLWQKLDLRKIGIPFPSECKGLKILLTSRLEVVCRHMNAQKTLEVKMLAWEEAWDLFKMVAEISDPSIWDIAKQVACECAGLPIAIVTVGKALTGKQEYAYRDMLQQLRDVSKGSTSEIHDVLYKCIRASYDFLKNDEHRSLLLLCSSFPDDYEISIEDLVREAVGSLDIFESMEISYLLARDRVNVIVDELIDCYLLLDGNEEGFVKLHDVVRDVCLSIASEEGCVYTSRHGGLDAWPNNSELCTSIWLSVDRSVTFSSSLYCPKLQNLTLYIKNRCFQLSFLSDFMKSMQGLRSLGISEAITSFPSSSLQFLINLRKLSLKLCELKGDMLGIGNLQMLRVLSFFMSRLQRFPGEISQLTNLMSLDLRIDALGGFGIVPSGILSSLKNLEELYLGNYFTKDGVDEHCKYIEEVSSLPKLHTIQYSTNRGIYLKTLLENLNLPKMIRFDISMSIIYKYLILKNSLELINIDMINFLDVRGLLVKLEKLSIIKARHLEELFHSDLLDGSFAKLQELHLKDLDFRDNLWRPFQSPSVCNLRKLHIENCGNIKSIFIKSTVKFLGQLNEISVQFCQRFERLVTCQDGGVEISEVILFPELRKLSLKFVPMFRSMGPESDNGADSSQVYFPKLEILEIDCSGTTREGSEAQVKELHDGFGSSLPNLLSMKVISCHNLLVIAKFKFMERYRNIVQLEVINCASVEVVFDFAGINASTSVGGGETILLGQIKFLTLKHLPKLKHLCRMPPNETQKKVICPVLQQSPNGSGSGHRISIISKLSSLLHKKAGLCARHKPTKTTDTETNLMVVPSLPFLAKETCVFQNLTTLQVSICNNLKYLLNPTTANMLVSLEQLFLDWNTMMEAVIGWDENDAPNAEEILEDKIVLPNLKVIRMNELENLRMICCYSNLALEIPSLTHLEISDCPAITSLCPGEFSARDLKTVHYYMTGIQPKGIEVSLDDFINTWLKGSESKTEPELQM